MSLLFGVRFGEELSPRLRAEFEPLIAGLQRLSKATLGLTNLPVLRRTTTITNAQIKALAISPVQLVPPVGKGYRLCLHLATLRMNSLGGAYTNIDAAGYAVLRFSNGAGGFDEMSTYLQNGGGYTDFTELLTPAARVTATFREYSLAGVAFAMSNLYENAELQLFFSNGVGGALTGGYTGNSLIVTVYYSLEAV